MSRLSGRDPPGLARGGPRRTRAPIDQARVTAAKVPAVSMKPFVNNHDHPRTEYKSAPGAPADGGATFQVGGLTPG